MTSPLEYYDENIPCLAACPVHTNAGMYVAAIADGDDELAYLTARLPNPFASVCGRVCAAPCEDACRRGEIDRPIAIRALKRFVTEQFGPERRDAAGRGCGTRSTNPPAADRAESIGIVGGGPAGLAAAHDLRRLGYGVTVYEATDKLGGAMWLGIPEYRLDRAVLNADIDAILELGVEVHSDTRLGVDVTLDRAPPRHDAVFLAIGATLGRGLDIEGGDADGVFKAIEFLINMNRGFEVDVGERVLVVGGGDVAMDAARTALRAADYQAAAGTAGDGAGAASTTADEASVQPWPTPSTSPGPRLVPVPARSASCRSSLATRCRPTSRDRRGRTRGHRPSPPSRSPAHRRARRCRRRGRDHGRDVGLRRRGPLRSGLRRRRHHHLRRRHRHPGHRSGHRPRLARDHGPEISPRRTIAVDPDTGATSLADVWSGGDAAKGPRTLIDAIADGRRSAADIHRSFGGTCPKTDPARWCS